MDEERRKWTESWMNQIEARTGAKFSPELSQQILSFKRPNLEQVRKKWAEAPEFPFQHAAAEPIREIVMQIKVRTREEYLRLPRRDRYVLDVCLFETKFMNGGMDHYISCCGEYVSPTLEALMAIGAGKSYQLLKRVYDRFPEVCTNEDFKTRRARYPELRDDDRRIDEFVEGEIEVDLYQ